MGQMKEIQNDGQFDPFVREIIISIDSIVTRIKECEFIPEGMEKVFDRLIDTLMYVEDCYSNDKMNEMYGDNLED